MKVPGRRKKNFRIRATPLSLGTLIKFKVCQPTNMWRRHVFFFCFKTVSSSLFLLTFLCFVTGRKSYDFILKTIYNSWNIRGFFATAWWVGLSAGKWNDGINSPDKNCVHFQPSRSRGSSSWLNSSCLKSNFTN